MRLIKWILPILVLAAAFFIFMQLKASKPQLPPKPAEERVWSVHAESIQLARLSPQIELYAAIENPQKVKLTSSLAADVLEVNILEGERFRQGDLLIRLDTQDIDLQVLQQEAQLTSLESQLASENLQYESDLEAVKIQQEMVRISQRALKRQQDLSTRNLASREQLDAAEINTQQQNLNLVSRQQSIANHPNRVAQLQASIAQARAQLDSLSLDRKRAFIYARFDGRVSSVNIASGDRVKNGDLLAQIYPDNAVEARAQLPLTTLSLIKQSDGRTPPLQGEVQIDGKTLAVTLDRLSADVTTGSAGIDGLFRFKNSTIHPEPGRTLSLTLNLPLIDDVTALPASALYGTDRIYQIKDSRLKAIRIQQLGARTGSNGEPQVLIRSPELRDGDQIITTQLPNAISGLLVEVAK